MNGQRYIESKEQHGQTAESKSNYKYKQSCSDCNPYNQYTPVHARRPVAQHNIPEVQRRIQPNTKPLPSRR